MSRVLILEDEESLRGSMARGIGMIPGVTVVEAGSMDEAARSLDETPPDLVFSDIDLPERSGVEILGELARRGLKVPVIFVSAYVKAYRAQIPRHADVDVREKPVTLAELREIVQSRLGRPEAGASAEAAPFSAADYLQLACMGRHSMAIELLGRSRPAGHLEVVAGELTFAADETGEGEAAFCRLILDRGLVPQCHTLRETPRPRNIYRGYEELLLDIARKEDESSSSRGGPAVDGHGFETAWKEGAEALLDRDFPRAARAFVRAQRLNPADGRVTANLVRLRDMGVSGDGDDDLDSPQGGRP